MSRSSERGAGNIKAIIALVVLVLFVYSLAKTVPHFMNNYELNDFMLSEARYFSYGQRTETEVRANVVRKANELNIPTDTLRITKEGRRVRMYLAYTAVIELPGYTYNKNFLIEIDNIGV